MQIAPFTYRSRYGLFMITFQSFFNSFCMYYIGNHEIFHTLQVLFLFLLQSRIMVQICEMFYETINEEKTMKTHYETLISSIEETMIKVDHRYELTYISKTFNGIEPKNYINQHIKSFEFLDQNLIKKSMDSMERCSWNWNNNDGFYSFTATPIQEETVSILIICLDVTEMNKRKENDLKLIKAETSLKSKIEFIASISHEIRNPLQAAYFSIENLQETSLNILQKEYLNDVKSSNQLASNIIGDILDISKIEAGKMKINYGRMNLLDVCERSIENYYHEARKKGLDLFLTFEPDLPLEIDCDSLRILQIINNFISNAIKYSHKGKIHLHMKKTEINENRFLKITIKDEGIGLSKDDLSKIFTPFEQFGKKPNSKG